MYKKTQIKSTSKSHKNIFSMIIPLINSKTY